MPVTPQQLDKPIDASKSAFAKMLSTLQGNILKGHGRDNTRNLFLKFDPARKAEARAALRALAAHVTSASEQLRQAARFKATGMSGGTTLFIFLSAKGYAALGIASGKTPPDPRFRAGMKSASIDDPAPLLWDMHFRDDLHGMILIADDCIASLDSAQTTVTAKLAAAGIVVVGVEVGLAQRNSAGEGIEHFGYVDGRSQPLMLKDDVARELQAAGGSFEWDPAMGPGQIAIVRDPGTAAVDAFGSYFIFRKLEQNVQGFKDREDQLATALGLTGGNRELAGAMVVGRFENGAPVVAAPTTSGHPPVDNNFGFDADQDGAKCPFAAHIRKTNPRGDSVALGATLASERLHLMPRRGITYGERTDDFESDDDKPTGGVGLLFMAYNKDVGRQFEFTQASWANNDSFARPGTGPDPVIGQGPAGANSWPTIWGDAQSPKVDFTFGQFVTMKGGEYFFAPSIPTLAAL